MAAIPKAFYSLQAVGRMLGVPSDTIKEAFRGKSLDSIQAIKPIAHLFHCFKEGDSVSYAILKKHYDKWQRTGEVPKVSTGRPPKWKGNPDVTQIRGYIKNEVYDEFRAIVKKANSMSVIKVTYRDMLAVAIQEFNDRRRHILDGDA